MLQKGLCIGGTILAGFATGVALTEIFEKYRRSSEADAYKNDKAFNEYEEEEEFEEEEEQQNVKDSLDIPLEKACAVFFIRKDLKMRNGKIAAQCGHAALGIFKKVSKHYNKYATYWYDKEFKKYFFYVKDEEQMNEFLDFADDNGILREKIIDAGRTQIAAGSATVLAIGPVDEDIVSSFTSNLTKYPGGKK